MSDVDEFRKQVRHNDYKIHVIATFTALLGFLFTFVQGNPFVGLGICGCSLIVAGIFAIRGRESSPLWQKVRAREDMPLAERRLDSVVNGVFLILLGTCVLGWVVKMVVDYWSSGAAP